jgi:hypothetical protein
MEQKGFCHRPPLSALTPTVSPPADKLSGSVVVGTKAESVRIIPSSNKWRNESNTSPKHQPDADGTPDASRRRR